MDILNQFKFIPNEVSEKKAHQWQSFLQQNNFDFSLVKSIDLTSETARIHDQSNNKFSIDFLEDRQNYQKKKSSMKKELIGRAMGSGRYGLKILDLSAGLAIDAVFLAQLGFEVTALERNPLIYSCLNEASQRISHDLKLKFVFESAQKFLAAHGDEYDVIYFDPMFPDKKKSALPRQEMVFFRHLVGSDEDAEQVLQMALQKFKAERVVVKRPLKAPFLLKKPSSQIVGKLIRFDVYGVHQ